MAFPPLHFVSTEDDVPPEEGLTDMTETAGHTDHSHLRRGMGLLPATATNIIGMVGVGPFLVIPFMITSMGGPHILYAWLAGAVLAFDLDAATIAFVTASGAGSARALPLWDHEEIVPAVDVESTKSATVTLITRAPFGLTPPAGFVGDL